MPYRDYNLEREKRNNSGVEITDKMGTYLADKLNITEVGKRSSIRAGSRSNNLINDEINYISNEVKYS